MNIYKFITSKVRKATQEEVEQYNQDLGRNVCSVTLMEVAFSSEIADEVYEEIKKEIKHIAAVAFSEIDEEVKEKIRKESIKYIAENIMKK